MSGPAPSIELRIGLEGYFERAVLFEYTTAHLDPRLPEIFSTPAMIGMMEAATSHAVDGALGAGKISVGTRIEVDHVKSARLGAMIVSTARLVEIKGRYLTFEVESRDGDVVLGRGRIVRAIVDLARVQSMLAQNPRASQ